jgi:YVTN family beta-propeller protein
MSRTFAYVNNSDGVSVIDTSVNEVTAKIPLVNAGVLLAAAPDGRRVYASSGFSVAAIGTATNSVVATVGTMNNMIVRGVVTPDGKHAYLLSSIPIPGGFGAPLGPDTLRIQVLATATETIAAGSIDIADVGAPGAVAVSANGGLLYCVGTAAAVVVDMTLNKLVAKIAVPAAGPNELKGLAITRDGKRAYVTDVFDQVTVLDLTNNSSLATMRKPAGISGLGSIAMSPDGQRAYVVGYDAIAVIDTANNTATGSIPLPNSAVSVLAVTPDGKTIYVGGSSSIYAVDVATSAVTDTLTLACSAIAIVSIPT